MPGGGWVGTHEDITELKAVRAAANERLSLQALIDKLPDNLWVKDINSRFVIANQVTADRIGVAEPADLIGKTDFELLPRELAQKFYDDEQQIVRTGQPMVDMEEIAWGLKQWISTTKVPLRNDRNEIFGVAGDLARHHRAQAGRRPARRAGENPRNDRDERSARRRARRISFSSSNRNSTGLSAPVLLLDETGPACGLGAAPSLPDAYVKAIDGVPIGPKAGSCGTAAYRRETVIVDDIMSDPLWDDYRDLAAEHGLRSCWSTPILSHQGAVLGTFAMYAEGAARPTDAEIAPDRRRDAHRRHRDRTQAGRRPHSLHGQP